jgi:hypothetical protein
MHLVRILAAVVLMAAVWPLQAQSTESDATLDSWATRPSPVLPSGHRSDQSEIVRFDHANEPPTQSREEGASFEASGAAGDGLTDDSEAINAYLATLKDGGLVRLAAGKQYLINGANLVVPPNVTLQGLSSPQSPAGAISLSKASGMIINPAYTVVLGHGSQLRDLFIRRAGMIANPSAAQVIAAVGQWGQERSVGITIPPHTGGVMITDVFIEGFNTCLKASAGQFSIQSLSGDCYNGLEVMHAGDNHYIDKVRFEPYYGLASPAASGSWARPGIAFNLHDGNTGTVLTRAFSFMYASGVVLNETGITQISDSDFEWQAKFGNGITGTKGLRWINHNSATSVIGTAALGFDTKFSDEGVGEVMMTAVEAPASRTNTTFNLAGAPAVPSAVTLGGRVSAGDLVSLSLTGPDLPGSPLTLHYAVVAGDDISSIADELAHLVNANQALIASGVFAGVSSAVVTIKWPAAHSVAVNVTATGDITASIGTAPRPAGSSGAIIGANTIGADGLHPIYTFGPKVLSWHIDTPFTGDNALPAHWVSVDPASIDRVALTGVRWSAHPELIDCGTNGPSLNETATDASGTITEGSGVSECTLKFRTAWPWTPACIVASPSGSALTGYRVTAAALTIINPTAARNRYTYHCSP